MKTKAVLTAVLALCLSVVSFAQDVTFRHIIGRNPNSTDFRAAFNAARRNHVAVPGVTSSLLGDDWQVGLGPNGGLALGQYPATWPYTLGVNMPSCSDWVMFPINATPAVGGQANAVVYNSLYRGTGGLCGTGAPVTLTALALGSSPITSSPVVSFKGTSRGIKFAVVEGANATIHIVKIGNDAGTTTNAMPADCIGTDSCDQTVQFTTIASTHCVLPATHTALQSKLGLYVDYSNDEGYIGDDAGKVYHLTGVFNGTPTVDFCSGVINAGAPIGEVIHVNIGGTDFVYFQSNARLFRMQVNAARTGFSGTSSIAVSGVATGFLDFLFDVDDNSIYAWTNHDTTAGGGHAALLQIASQTTPMTVAANINIGLSSSVPFFLGDFDNTFFTLGPTAAGATGYTCVLPNGSTGTADLASFQFNASGVISGLTAMTANTHMNPAAPNTGNGCTNITTLYDSAGAVDSLWVSSGNGTNTNNNKLSRFDITTPLTSNATLTSASSTVAIGGTSGVVIDNTDSGLGGQTQNLYFGDTAQPTTNRCGQTGGVNNYCAVKLQQITLN